MSTMTATARNAIDVNAKAVDASLWWDPFGALLTELEEASVSGDVPLSLEKKIKDNRLWFLETVSRFKTSSQESREALDSRTLKIGLHELDIKPELKDVALKISSVLCLDEVQSYILVARAVEQNDAAAKDIHPQTLDMVILEYYIERQCLLKCTRQLFVLALYLGTLSEEASVVLEEAKGFISGGLERKLLSTFQDLLSSSYPEHMDIDLYTLWAEETLVENNLILDILFLGYYESFCTCDATSWKRLFEFYEGIASGSYNFQKLAVSTEAVHSIYHTKVQLLVILIEALDLENLLQMIHDNVPFRQGSITFSETDIQEMDVMVSSFSAFEAIEAGPLILAWAVFLCLISSLPDKEEDTLLMEIDHIGYVRQAFEASSLSYFLEVLRSETLDNSDGPQAGYRSVIRTFVSAFIASYEISLQFDDKNLKLILDILCNIYKGEESLCIQFWDKDSFIDGPVRCLLCNLEGEFPFRTVELVSLLSALSEGAWPSQCVFTFLDKAVGLSTPFEISSDSIVDAAPNIVETNVPLHISGVEGLVIPEKSRGQVLRMISKNRALVRWEYAESGVLFLLLRLSQGRYIKNSDEIIIILDLLSRLVTFNEGVCYSLMDAWNSFHDEVTVIRNQEKQMRVNIVEIICSLVKYLSPSASGAKMMSLGVNILTKMLKCLPSHVATLAMKSNIFDFASRTSAFDASSNNLSSGSWLLSGRLAKMLLIDCEQNDCSMTLSVLDFAIKILETGLETDTVLALVTFSVQYVLVDHEFWKYKVKHSRWKVTVKVLEVIKKCIWFISCSQRIGEFVRDILLDDSSVHSALFRIVCTTRESLEQLYLSRLVDVLDIEGLQLAISSGFDVLVSMLSTFSEDSDALPVFHQAILSPMTKPIPVIAAAMSLASYSRDSKIQIGATMLLSRLFSLQSFTYRNASFGLDDKEVTTFRKSICSSLCKQSSQHDDLVIATLKLLTAAARYQPAFLTALTVDKEYWNAQPPLSKFEHQTNKIENVLSDPQEQDLSIAISQLIKISEELFNSKPSILLNLSNFLRALWEGAPQFTKILEQLKNSDQLWKQLTKAVTVTLVTSNPNKSSGKLTEKKLVSLEYRYRYLSDVLYILDYEIFLQKKLMHAQLVVNQMSKSTSDGTLKRDESAFNKDRSLSDLKGIISAWSGGPILSDLIKSCVSLEYDDHISSRSKIAAGLLAVHVMVKLKCGDSGSLSISLIERVIKLMQKMQKLSSFSELLTLYAKHGHSAGQELENLIISDLFYHIQGELEGRQIDNRPFKELLQFLIDSDFLGFYKHNVDDYFTKYVSLYDIVRIKADLGFEMWDLSTWNESKEVAETLLLSLQDANSALLLSSSKLSALRGLIALLSMQDENSTENDVSAVLNISELGVSSCTELVCQYLHSTIVSLSPFSDASEDMLDILTAQVELLLLLIRNKSNIFSRSVIVNILKTAGFGLKVLCDGRPLVGTGAALKYVLLLILYSLKLMHKDLHSDEITGTKSEVANASLSLLPVLCHCLVRSHHFTLSVIAIDTILKGFSTHTTWLPIIQEYLPRQLIVRKLQDVTSSETISILLKFLLNIARVRLGAELLVNAGILGSLKILLSNFYEEGPIAVVRNEIILSNSSDKSARPIWGLSMAILTAIIQSLGDGSGSNIVDYVMGWILVERAPTVSYYLSAPDFPGDGHEKKRARAFKSNISLTELKETEDTLALICVLAIQTNSWKKILQDVGPQLREKCIHLLAFISRATQRPGELHTRDAPLLCHPAAKEEFEQYKSPSFITSRHGWFPLAALGCKLDFASLSSRTVAQASGLQSNDLSSHTQLSDMVAVELYKIAFLLLRFLCIQAEHAASKAEEVGFVDIAYFPELPMPEILQGLQDQGIVIVTELCEEANKSKQLAPEAKDLCLLLLNITVMALYLEFCVIQICGIRPVLGYVETFSKEFRLLIRATESHGFLDEPLKSLKQIVSFVYPELTQAESLF